jgi:hypothetical protein
MAFIAKVVINNKPELGAMNNSEILLAGSVTKGANVEGLKHFRNDKLANWPISKLSKEKFKSSL